MNPTNDASLKSFVDVASDSDFSIQNLPYCAFTRSDEEHPRIGVRVGEYILDLKVLEHTGHFKDTALGDTHVFCVRGGRGAGERVAFEVDTDGNVRSFSLGGFVYRKLKPFRAE